MSKLQQLANSSAENFRMQSGMGDNSAFDPSWIMVFAEIIMQLVEAFQECQADVPEAAGMAKSPSLIQRIVLRRKVINMVGRREFIRNGNNIMDALLETGESVTVEDMAELYDEVH